MKLSLILGQKAKPYNVGRTSANTKPIKMKDGILGMGGRLNDDKYDDCDVRSGLNQVRNHLDADCETERTVECRIPKEG
jgi:hypothetical protein